jgi:hypothetical protein
LDGPIEQKTKGNVTCLSTNLNKHLHHTKVEEKRYKKNHRKISRNPVFFFFIFSAWASSWWASNPARAESGAWAKWAEAGP